MCPITDRMLDRTSSPKLNASARRAAIYRYYAGFSEEFVESLLNTIDVSPSDCVLDPWNGSGTTTAVCSRHGVASVGIDINPAMRPVAAVRSMRSEKLQDLCDIAINALEAAPTPTSSVSPFAFCNAVFENAKAKCETELHDGLRFGFMAACRSAARRIRSKNPTWHSLSSLKALHVDAHAIEFEIRASFRQLSERGQQFAAGSLSARTSPVLITGDWNTTEWPSKSTHIVTSPPYLTRIDYVMKTLPELLFLNEEASIDIQSLRRNMLGSVLTTGMNSIRSKTRSSLAKALLAQIAKHTSKASTTYYYRFFDNYMRLIDTSFQRMTDRDSPPKTVTVVSQGSYYKEIFVDLPAIIDDIMIHSGYKLMSEYPFTTKNHMAMVNSRSAASSLPAPAEMAAIYRRV